eukprot:6683495-Pyramimonas_sp.AAC.1
MVFARIHLAIHRSMWFQQWVSFPEEHMQLIAAMFADFPEQKLNNWFATGTVASTAHSALK